MKHWESIIGPLAVRCLDRVTHRDWEQSIDSSKEPATYDEMMKFLKERLSILTSLEQSSLARQTTDKGRKINDKSSNKNNSLYIIKNIIINII